MLSFYHFCLNCIEFPKLVTKIEEFTESSQLKMNSECFSGNCFVVSSRKKALFLSGDKNTRLVACYRYSLPMEK